MLSISATAGKMLGGAELSTKQRKPTDSNVSMKRGSHLNKNKKECIDDLNYIKKALMEGSLYQYDAIIFIIDTIARYLFVDDVNLVDDEKAARHE